MNDEELERILGVVGFEEYQQSTGKQREEVLEFAATVEGLSDAEFVTTAAYRIEESARFASGRGNYWAGIHAMASGCHTESGRRFKAAGHADDCRATGLYVKAYNRVARKHGHSEDTVRSCTCGAGGES